MATSGSVDFTRTRDQIIRGALRLCEAIAAGETPSSEETVEASEALNLMAKAWQADGIHLWAQDEGVLFLEKGTAKYSLGPSGDEASTAYVTTTTTADIAASGTSLALTSITGISASDNIGIVQDDGTFHWDTVSGTPSSLTVTLTTGMTSAAASGNRIFTFTSLIMRPIRILDARLKVNNGNEIPFVDMLTRDEYFDLPNKTNQGKPVQAYYDPQLTNGEFHIWNAADDINDVVLFTFMRPIEDFDAAANNPDFPQEWENALKWNLAVEIAPEYGVPMDKRAWLRGMADEKKQTALAFDHEPESIYFQPEIDHA
ncbi:hypothetical protein LCGC14_0355200 [marine sediment metagenome]|uniref:Uncharacterized protein n=1 Tax=marine sediment metagenome TaxID=412755 RepID=A0A0F9T9Q9_9ZZZZ